MKTCDAHDDAIVVYDSYDCPVCAEIDENNTAIEELNDKLDTAESRIEELENPPEPEEKLEDY